MLQQIARARSAQPGTERISPGIETQWQQTHSLDLPCRRSSVEWCREQNLEFDAVNDNLPEIIEYYGHNSRKILCDYYIDDRMLLPENANA